MGRGQGLGSQARTQGTQGRVYAVVPQAEHSDQPGMQGTFLYLHLLSNESCSLLHFVLGFWAWRLRPLEEPVFGKSPLRPRVRVDKVC